MMVMKHDAHPLLLDPVSALLVGCGPPSTLVDMNVVEVCVSIAGPAVGAVEKCGVVAVVVGVTGVVVVAGNEVLDELEVEDEDVGSLVLEEECVDEGGGVSVLVDVGVDDVDVGGLGVGSVLCWGQSMLWWVYKGIALTESS